MITSSGWSPTRGDRLPEVITFLEVIVSPKWSPPRCDRLHEAITSARESHRRVYRLAEVITSPPCFTRRAGSPSAWHREPLRILRWPVPCIPGRFSTPRVISKHRNTSWWNHLQHLSLDPFAWHREPLRILRWPVPCIPGRLSTPRVISKYRNTSWWSHLQHLSLDPELVWLRGIRIQTHISGIAVVRRLLPWSDHLPDGSAELRFSSSLLAWSLSLLRSE